MSHVFISYSRKDRWHMRSVYWSLKSAGFRVWFDSELKRGGENRANEILDNIVDASCMVCFALMMPVSPHMSGKRLKLRKSTTREYSPFLSKEPWVDQCQNRL